jgi:hypothetical protein
VKKSTTLRVRPLGPLHRWAYRRAGVTPPVAESKSPTTDHLVVIAIPYRWRRFHHWYANRLGYFWLPCPICGREFGGHEWGGSVQSTNDPGLSSGVCIPCTKSDPERFDQ